METFSGSFSSCQLDTRKGSRCHREELVFHCLGLCVLLLTPWSVCSAQATGGTEEMFSSMSSMRNLKQKEAQLIESVESYLVTEEVRLRAIRSLLAGRYMSAGSFRENPATTLRTLDHPITSYSFIGDWASIVDKMQDKTNFETAILDAQSRGGRFPSTTDRLGALRALLRLQQVYNISVDEMAAGKVRRHKARPSLSTRDFYDLGMTSYLSGQRKRALDWFQKALDVANDGISKRDILYYMALTHHAEGNVDQAILKGTKALALDARNHTIRISLHDFKRAKKNMHDQRNTGNSTVVPLWRQRYESLCRGEESPRDPGWKGSGLRCEYRARLVPYAPFKFEVLHTDPWIALIYEALSEKDSAIMKELAGPQLNRAKVGDPAKPYVTDGRVSKITWLWDSSTNNTIHYLSKRVEIITGLSTKYRSVFASAEPFQVINYGMGGQYEPHLDACEDKRRLSNVPLYIQHTGDRIATFMFYLSDVVEGGATVFPVIGVYVPPVKNAAVFWFNIHRHGELDRRTQHAGCPVLVGEKWVANKWIREHGQAFRRPCGLSTAATETDGVINGALLGAGQ